MKLISVPKARVVTKEALNKMDPALRRQVAADAILTGHGTGPHTLDVGLNEADLAMETFWTTLRAEIKDMLTKISPSRSRKSWLLLQLAFDRLEGDDDLTLKVKDSFQDIKKGTDLGESADHLSKPLTDYHHRHYSPRPTWCYHSDCSTLRGEPVTIIAGKCFH